MRMLMDEHILFAAWLVHRKPTFLFGLSRAKELAKITILSTCGELEVKKAGFRDSHPYRQRYECRKCNNRFDDLMGIEISSLQIKHKVL